MLKENARFLKSIFIGCDIVIICTVWLILCSVFETKAQESLKEHMMILFLLCCLNIIIFISSGLYKPRRASKLIKELLLVLKASCFSLVSFALVLFVSEGLTNYHPEFIFNFFLLSVPFLFIFRILLRNLLHRLRRKGYNVRRVLIVGTGKMAQEFAKKLYQHQEFGYEVVGFLLEESKKKEIAKNGMPVLGTYKEIKRIVGEVEIDKIIIALPIVKYQRIKTILSYIDDSLSDIYILPDNEGFFTLRHGVENFDGSHLIRLRESPINGWNYVLKRSLDIVVSLTALFILFPLMFFIVCLIKLTSKGPLFYVQERMGLDGKTFKMYKFRSMKVNAEVTTGAVWAKENDPRRTKIGALLRRTSLDELPQFINVLRGQMSLVGPRPERPVFIEKFKKEIEPYALRHKVKAGITGWAQINGLRGNSSIDKRVAYDLAYIENWSLLLDLKIILYTIPAIFKGEGAY
jgi:Undecaprenyl-phosphate glucose phosphotransferase